MHTERDGLERSHSGSVGGPIADFVPNGGMTDESHPSDEFGTIAPGGGRKRDGARTRPREQPERPREEAGQPRKEAGSAGPRLPDRAAPARTAAAAASGSVQTATRSTGSGRATAGGATTEAACGPVSCPAGVHCATAAATTEPAGRTQLLE